MTPEEKNLKFTKDSIFEAGFGDRYHALIDAGYRSGRDSIELPEFVVPLGGNNGIKYEPKVTEGNDRGRYNFNGYLATLYVEGKEPTVQFFPSYMMTGMTLENALFALQGGTVLHRDYDKREKETKMVFSRLDLSVPVEPGENHPVIRANARDLNMAMLLSKEDISLDANDKKKLLAKIQTGTVVDVRIRETVNGKERTVPVSINLNLKDPQTMSLQVFDSEGTLLREPDIKVKQRAQLRGVVLGEGTEAALPEGLLRMMKDHDPDKKFKRGMSA